MKSTFQKFAKHHELEIGHGLTLVLRSPKSIAYQAAQAEANEKAKKDPKIPEGMEGTYALADSLCSTLLVRIDGADEEITPDELRDFLVGHNGFEAFEKASNWIIKELGLAEDEEDDEGKSETGSDGSSA